MCQALYKELGIQTVNQVAPNSSPQVTFKQVNRLLSALLGKCKVHRSTEDSHTPSPGLGISECDNFLEKLSIRISKISQGKGEQGEEDIF